MCVRIYISDVIQYYDDADIRRFICENNNNVNKQKKSEEVSNFVERNAYTSIAKS